MAARERAARESAMIPPAAGGEAGLCVTLRDHPSGATAHDVIAGLLSALRVLAAGVAVVCLAAAVEATEPRSVLLIYADPRLAPAIVTIDQSLRQTIVASVPGPVRFHTEYLDLSWFPGLPEGEIGRIMGLKYAAARFDVVVPCGQEALRFALRERSRLFPGVPIVFCTIEDGALDGMTLPPDVTGVTTFRDWAASLDLILSLHPGTRQIVFIGGSGPIERGWEALARTTFARYERRLTFTYLTGRPIEEIVAAVDRLSEGSVILFNVFLRDVTGRSFSSPEALHLVAPAARVPMYGAAESQLGHGIVGGVLVSYEAQARAAGELAARVLGGAPLGPAEVVRRVPSVRAFDARQLARWGIDERRLPAGSVVRFREPSLWREYRWHAVAVLGFVLAQSALVVGLLAERRRRRRVRAHLDERLRFETLMADLAAAFVEIPAREVDARIGQALDRIVRELEVDRVTLAEVREDAGTLQVTHASVREGAPPLPRALTTDAWPWSQARLRQGQAVCFARLADLPPEAERDRRSFETVGTCSMAVVPVIAAGVVRGALSCSMTRREREWPDDLVQRLRLLADTFAVVLMRQRAESALEESEGRFQAMVDAAPVLMWRAGPDGLCTGFNREWLRFTGRTLAQELGEGWLEGVHPADRETCRGEYLAALGERRPFTLGYRLRRADGVYRDVLDRGVPRLGADSAFGGYVGSAVDVTEVKAAQQVLVESLALRSAIFGSLYGLVAAVDRTGVIVAVNESWTRALGEGGGEVWSAGVGVNYLDVCHRAAAAGDASAAEAAEAMRAVLAGRVEHQLIEYACRGPAGERWYAMIIEPFRRPEGGLVIAHVDVTRRRRAEEAVQREREELAHALRVATLGELATSLAHEINQPLAAIASNAQAAQRLLGGGVLDPEIPEMLHDIRADAQRAAQIIRRLRVLFKKEHAERHPVDVTEVIKEVVALLRKELERREITLEVALHADLPRVLGDIVQLQQVLLNVLVNATEAMGRERGPRDLRVATGVGEPGVLSITVRDSGVGVPPGELERIFQRFVTTKPEGLGMGLSISRSIVDAHGGRIWATANPDGGLTVHIELPYVEEAP
jgi:PAS domain S-box-containing protein